jgi:uncharacterized protein (DUF302 family)
MSYYFSKVVTIPFDEAITKVADVLKREGFGILTRIDVKEILRKKLDVNFREYCILGACNPPFAYQALQAEDKIGLMLPCNVIVQDHGQGHVEIAAVDPLASMAAVDNDGLRHIADQVRVKLKRVINNL